MPSLRRAFYVAVSTFACAMIGMALQHVLPGSVINEGKASVGSVVGVLATLLALVLGLLIWTSFGVYATQQTEAQSLSVTVLQLDYLLEQYGPESAPGRRGLRDAVRQSRERYFGSRRADTELTFAAARDKLHGIDSFFSSLHPEDDARKQLLASARPMATSVVDTQLLMSRQLINPVPELLLIMVQTWTSLLFLGFGVIGGASWIAGVADAAGAFAIASAIFLIVEFSEPYSGLFRIRSHGIDKVIAELDANAPPA